METFELKNTVETDALAPRSIEDIRANYPDEWILLGNPVMDEYRRVTPRPKRAVLGSIYSTPLK